MASAQLWAPPALAPDAASSGTGLSPSDEDRCSRNAVTEGIGDTAEAGGALKARVPPRGYQAAASVKAWHAEVLPAEGMSSRCTVSMAFCRETLILSHADGHTLLPPETPWVPDSGRTQIRAGGGSPASVWKRHQQT